MVILKYLPSISILFLFLFASDLLTVSLASKTKTKTSRIEREYEPENFFLHDNTNKNISLNRVMDRPSKVGAHMHLVHASLLFRHGDRTPTSLYPNDPIKEDSFLNGFGSLTNIGKLHSFQLGQDLYKRYIKMMKVTQPFYDHRNVSFRSTDVRRSLETVQYMANGMYPPSEDQMWKEGVDWQAFPIHTVAKNDDQMLRPYDGNCRSLNSYLDSIQNSDEWLEYEKKNQDFLDQISTFAGYKVDLWRVNHLYTTLAIEASMNLELPSWVSNDVLEKLKKLSDYKTQAFFSINDNKYRTVSGGPFLYELLQNFAAYDPKKENKTFKLYSAHDSTLIAIFAALDTKLDHNPNFNAVISFEHYFDVENKKSYVRLFYKDGNDADFEELQFDKCSRLCELDDFIKIFESIAVEDRSQACKLSNFKKLKQSTKRH